MDSLSAITVIISFSFRALSFPTTARMGGSQHNPRMSTRFPSSIVVIIFSSFPQAGEDFKGEGTIGATEGPCCLSRFMNPVRKRTEDQRHHVGPCLIF
jgi:hypothetical protein